MTSSRNVGNTTCMNWLNPVATFNAFGGAQDASEVPVVRDIKVK